MTIEADTHQPNDHTIGIACCSRHKGLWYHRPRGLDGETSREVMGYGASRWSRGSTQFTGHTALLVRCAGRVVFIQGWVPNHNPVALIKTLVLGRPADGHWQDDTALLADPTALSYEVPVGALYTNPDCPHSLQAFFETVADQIGQYQLRPQNVATAKNCVSAAITVLTDYCLRYHAESPYTATLIRLNEATSQKPFSGQWDLIQNFIEGRGIITD